VWRMQDNQVRLYSRTWTAGGAYEIWTAILEDSKGFLDEVLIDGPHYHQADMRYTYDGAQCWWFHTVSTQGVGLYKKTATHKFYNYFWGTVLGGSTSAQYRTDRPTISRLDSQPWYLGGAASSGTYKNYSRFSSDPKGAISTPYWFFHAGGTHGTLSCSNCTTPTYTVTQRSNCCWDYNVQIRVSYGGLESESFWIFNDSPNSLHYIDVIPKTRYDGWETHQKLKVLDMCGGGMNWVAVNETFEDAEFVYPGPTTGWLLFNWQLGVWTGDEFDHTGAFLDKMYELRMPEKDPQPMNTGTNGNSEAPADTVSQATQRFFAGSPTNGAGVQVGQNMQVHYLDHGAHK
jgi:hypothetical protein